MRNNLASSFDGKGGYLDNIYHKNANEYKSVINIKNNIILSKFRL